MAYSIVVSICSLLITCVQQNVAVILYYLLHVYYCGDINTVTRPGKISHPPN